MRMVQQQIDRLSVKRTGVGRKPAPSLSCTRPKGAKPRQGKGIVTAVGVNYIMVKTTRIDYANCTAMNYGGDTTAPAVGDQVEWEGFVETNGNVMGQTLIGQHRQGEHACPSLRKWAMGSQAVATMSLKLP
ncbi:MAG: hypothetical protein ACHQ9S_22765 [Candidatus Binatia bacterium]